MERPCPPPWMALLLALALAVPGLAEPPSPAAAASDHPASELLDPDSPAPAGEAATRATSPRPIARRANAPSVAAPASTTSPAGSGWLRTTASLAAVVALILLLAWGYRRTIGPLAGVSLARGRNLGLIEVISRATLGPRHTLHLVRVGARLVLVGTAQDGVRTLDVITDPDQVSALLGQAAQQRAESATRSFAGLLEAESTRYPASDEAPRAAAPPDEVRLRAAQDAIAAAVERLRAAEARA